MPRLSIDITEDQHRKLKAIAALNGQSLKDYVMTRTLGDTPNTAEMTEEEAWAALVDFLNERVAQARRREFSTRTVEEIKVEARRRAGL